MALGAISLVAFDVNGTLSDMSAMTDRFAEVNASPEMAQLWFAQVLRDGFALTAAGSKERFSVLAEDGLRRMLGDVELNRPIDHAVSSPASRSVRRSSWPFTHGTSTAR